MSPDVRYGHLQSRRRHRPGVGFGLRSPCEARLPWVSPPLTPCGHPRKPGSMARGNWLAAAQAIHGPASLAGPPTGSNSAVRASPNKSPSRRVRGLRIECRPTSQQRPRINPAPIKASWRASSSCIPCTPRRARGRSGDRGGRGCWGRRCRNRRGRDTPRKTRGIGHCLHS